MHVCRNPDLNRKTYEEVTGVLKSIRSLHFLRVDINPEFGLPELTAEVGAAASMCRTDKNAYGMYSLGGDIETGTFQCMA
jgi:hypothetical protein